MQLAYENPELKITISTTKIIEALTFIGSTPSPPRVAHSFLAALDAHDLPAAVAVAHDFPEQRPGHIGPAFQGFIAQMGVALRHGRALVRQELLQGVHIHLAGTRQHGSVNVP